MLMLPCTCDKFVNLTVYIMHLYWMCKPIIDNVLHWSRKVCTCFILIYENMGNQYCAVFIVHVLGAFMVISCNDEPSLQTRKKNVLKKIAENIKLTWNEYTITFTGLTETLCENVFEHNVLRKQKIMPFWSSSYL